MNIKTLALIAILLACATIANSANLINGQGKIAYLRAHAIGSAYGPPQDRIDVEVVIRLDSHPGMAFGLQLRDDNSDTAIRRAMFDLMRDAFINNWTVSIDYWINQGQQNAVIHRVWITR